MSYDVYMEIDTGLRMVTVEDVGNYTANVSPMYHLAIDGGLEALHGLTGGNTDPAQGCRVHGGQLGRHACAEPEERLG